MGIIKAKDLGIRFKLHRERRGTLRGSLARIFSSEQARIQEYWALRNISLTLEKGKVLGVIGRNGSGKSTLLRIIAGILTPDEGAIEVGGTISSLLSITVGFQAELSGLDNIYLNGVLLGFREKEIDAVLDNIVEFSELGRFIEVPVKTYSSGMRARLGFSIAINLHRDIMLVDEILGVGDTQFRQKCEIEIEQLMHEGKTIILVSHNMESIKKFADKVVLLEKGMMKFLGRPQEAIERYLAT
jgi:ABC-2 type transport system ATP-binding protein